MILDDKLSRALKKVSDQIVPGASTASYDAISPEDKITIKSEFHDLKTLLLRAGRDLNIAEHKLKLSMGKYQISGNMFPHLWGAYIPISAENASSCTTQLFVHRKHATIHWGISLSHRASQSTDFQLKFQDILSVHRDTVERHYRNGFSNHFPVSAQRIESQDSKSDSEGFIICRTKNLADYQVSEDQLYDDILEDLNELMPLYLELVKASEAKGLIGGQEQDENLNSKQDNDWLDKWKGTWIGSESVSKPPVPQYLQKELGNTWKSTKQQWEIGQRELIIAVDLANKGQDPGPERIKELIMGTLRRTLFSGGWRSHVLANFSSIAKQLKEFVNKNPSGCSQADLDLLLEELKPLTGGSRIKAVVTRWLNDLAPQHYLPVSDRFTATALAEAARLFDLEPCRERMNDNYELICREALRLAPELLDISDTNQLLEFDYFLFWLHYHYLPQQGAKPVTELIDPSDDEPRYWKISCGQGGRYAGVHRTTGRISIGWGEARDLHSYSTRIQIREELKTVPDLPYDPAHAAQQCWCFAHEIQVGDIVFGYGQGNILLIGEVTGPYEYLSSPADWNRLGNAGTEIAHQHTLPVKWYTTRKVAAKELPADLYSQITRTQTIIDLSRDAGQLILEKAGLSSEQETTSESSAQPKINIEQLCQNTGHESAFYERLKTRMQSRKQLIFAGPPGTGKTHVAEFFAHWFMGGKGQLLKLQFHPSYAYEDFVEGYRPLSNGQGFQVADGAFKEFCQEAITHPGEPYVIIIDEINRGHLAQIFGELLTLLEYREKAVIQLPYSKEDFYVPSNVYLIGTMNTADRSIALMDFALRRRFDFIEFWPSETALINFLQQHNCIVDPQHVTQFLNKLNEKISESLGRHYQIGHSYFMRPELDETILKDIWDFGIRPLIDEYFYNQPNLGEDYEFDKLWASVSTTPKVA